MEWVKTCDSFPEQYDVYVDGFKAAYVRLRNGVVTANYYEGDRISAEFYCEFIGDNFCGEFATETMRQQVMNSIEIRLAKSLEYNINAEDGLNMDKYKHDVATVLSNARTQCNMSMRQLSKEVGCPTSTIFRIEHEQVVPDLKTLCRICKVLHIGFTIDYSWYSDSLEVVF